MPDSASSGSGSSGSSGAEGSTSAAPPVPRDPGEIIDGRYRFVRELGHGGMGSVCLVEDLLHPGRELALKEIRKDRTDAKGIAILKNEYLALSRLRHPNLATVFDFGFDPRQGEYYFTAEYIRGVQLYKATRGLSLRDEMELRLFLYLFVEILRGLEFIHSRGLVHGDLKPENLLVSSAAGAREQDPTSGVRVKIIDFGLTKREKDFGGKKIFGTSCYIAPETILGSQVDRRTDLYSLGVVIYHMAARKLPFRGKSNFLILRGHLEDAPVPPSRILPEIPPQLDEIVLRLMAKKPGERYPSAAAVIDDINSRLSMRFPLETSETMCSYFIGTGCVARERELGELEQFFEQSFPQSDVDPGEGLQLCYGADSAHESEVYDYPPPPTGRFFLIRGEDKIGKRRLVQEFKDHVQVRDVHVVHIDLAPEEERSKENLRSLLRTLERCYVVRDEKFQSYITKVLSSLRAVLDEQNDQKEVAGLGLLADVMLLACRTDPVLIILSGLENGGESILNLVRILVQKIVSADDRGAHIMILATVREEEMEKPTLRRLLLSGEVRSHFREIALERLSREGFDELLRMMFGAHDFPDRLVDRIFDESDGNPGVVRDILEFFSRRGLLRRGAGGWECSADADRQEMPGRMRHELQARIQSLDADAIRLGLAFAFLGNSCELDLAAQVAGIAPSRILATLMELKRQRILREDGEGRSDSYSFAHRSARDLFCRLASAEDTVRIHRKAGAILERRLAGGGASGVENITPRVAYHYLRGANQEDGVRYGLEAARDHERRHLPRKALEMYRDVRRRSAEDAIPGVGDIDLRIAVLEAMVGNARRSLAILRDLLERHAAGAFDGRATRAEILVELAGVSSQIGDFRRAGRCLQEACNALKGGGSTGVFVKLLLAYGRLFQLRGNYKESARYCDRAVESVDHLDPVTQAQLLLLAAENHVYLRDPVRSIRYCTRALVAIDGRREPGYVGLSFLALGRFYRFKGRFENASRQFAVAAKAFRRCGVPEWEAESLLGGGRAHLVAGDAAAARSLLLRAGEIQERIGAVPALVETYRLLGDCHRLLGRYEEAEGYLRKGLALAGKLGVSRRIPRINLVCARTCLDRGLLAQAAEFVDVQNDTLPRDAEDEELVAARGELECQLAWMKGDFRRCLDLTALGTIRSRDASNRIATLPALELRARVYLELGRHDDARRAIDQLVTTGTDFGLPLVRARGDLLEGRALLEAGSPRRALRSFERSLERFKEKEAERDLAEVYLDLAAAELQSGNDERASLYLDEGFYLAKKLNLIYLRTLYLCALGVLDGKQAEPDLQRASNYFETAFRLASRHGFRALLWRIRLRQGELIASTDSRVAARRMLTEAAGLLQSALERIPDAYRESYRASKGGERLDELLRELSAEAPRGVPSSGGGAPASGRVPADADTSAVASRVQNEVEPQPQLETQE